MAWLEPGTWSAAASGNERLLSYGSNEADVRNITSGDTTYERSRERVSASWKITSLVEDSARMLVNVFQKTYMRQAAYPDVGAYLYLSGDPAESDATIDLINLRPSADGAYKIKAGWKFQIGGVAGDDTIYTVTADANLPTSGVEETNTQIIAPTVLMRGLDIDRTNGHIYFADHDSFNSTMWIKRCDLDGSNVTTIKTKSLYGNGTGFIFYVCVDPANSKIYFTFTPNINTGYQLRSMNYNGTGETVLFTHGTGVIPYDLDIDLENDCLYYAFPYDITKMDLDGSNQTTVTSDSHGVRANVNTGGFFYQRHSGGDVHEVTAGGTSTKIIDAAPSASDIIHDAATGDIYIVSGHDLHKYSASGDLLYSRIDYFYGNNVYAAKLSLGENAFFYTHSSQGVQKINLMTAAVTLSISPTLSDSFAIENGAEVYFFLTENVNANRADPSGSFELKLSGSYKTRFVRGPDIEQEA